MARKISKISSNRAGTGKISASDSAAEKWSGAVANQVATAAKVKSILTKTIPISHIITDPDNPRKLALNNLSIKKIARDFPIDKKLISADDPSEWLEGYIERVGQGANLVGKERVDFESLATFAASLKSADRLLHPIVVWKDESTFYLIAGERRLLAHILLGETHIAARIQTLNLNRAEIDTLQWEENVSREDMTLWERVDRVRKIIDTGEGLDKTSVTKLSKIIGRSRTESQRYLAILRCPDKELLQAIESGKVNNFKKAATLAQLSSSELITRLAGKKEGQKTLIKVHKSVNTDALFTIITAAAKQLNLCDSIKPFDSSNPSDLALALEELVAKTGKLNNG